MTDFQTRILFTVLLVVSNAFYYYVGKRRGENLNIERESEQYVNGFLRGVEATLQNVRQQNRTRHEDGHEE